ATGVLRAMFMNRVKTAGLLLCPLVALGAGALVIPGRADEPHAAQAGGEPPPRAVAKTEDRATIAAVERRLSDLERKLDAMMALIQSLPRKSGPSGAQRGRVDPASIRKVRPRFECLVEKIHVRAGQAVKKGEPLAEL